MSVLYFTFTHLVKVTGAWCLAIWADYFPPCWVHRMIFSIAFSHWKFQSLRILKYFNIVDCWLPSFVHVPLAKTFYYIYFGKQMSCLDICITILRYLVLHLLYIYQLIFDNVHLYMLDMPIGIDILMNLRNHQGASARTRTYAHGNYTNRPRIRDIRDTAY